MAIIILTGVPIISFVRLFVMAKYEVACFFDQRRQITYRSIHSTSYQDKYKGALDIIDGIFYGLIIAVGCPVVVFVCTIITSVKLWQTVRWRKQMSSAQSGKEIAVTKMLIVLSVFFFILTLPVVFIRVGPLFNAEFSGKGRYKMFYTAWASMAEVVFQVSMSYPFLVYYFASSRFKETFHSLFKNVCM